MSEHGWAKDMADRIRKHREKRTSESEEKQAQWSLVEAHAPVVWEEIKASVQANIKALNDALGEERLVWSSASKHEAKVGLGAGPYTASAEAKLDPHSFVISTVLVSTHHELKPQMVSGKLYFCDRGGVTKSPDRIAEEMIACLEEYI